MSPKKEYKPTPEPTIRRLPRYLHFLTRLKDEGVMEVSSSVIAEELSLDPTQVRKDIEYTKLIGKPRTGFNTLELIKAIERFLNWDNSTDAFIAGVGNLGRAIIGYKNFSNYGLNIVAAFDDDAKKIGKVINNITVLHIDKMTNLASRMHIHIGIITVPAATANMVAEKMVAGGIKAIWNFAPTQIKVPYGIIVENAQLSTNLSVLKRKLVETLQLENQNTEDKK